MRLLGDGAPAGPCVLAIAVFDGVHLGHRKLLRSARSDAKARSLPLFALVIERPYGTAPDHALLTPLEERERLIVQAGADAVFVLAVDGPLGTRSQEDIVHVIGDFLQPRSFHLPENLALASPLGELDPLLIWCAEHGPDARFHPRVRRAGVSISSAAVVEAVALGRIDEATRMLDRAPGLFAVAGERSALAGGHVTRLYPPQIEVVPLRGAFAAGARTHAGAVPAAVWVTPDGLVAAFGAVQPAPGSAVVLDLLGPLSGRETEHVQSALDAAAGLLVQGEEWDLGMLDDGSPVVSDAAALAAAEQSVRDPAPRPASRRLPDAPTSVADRRYVELASYMQFTGLPTDTNRIYAMMALAAALQEAGIEVQWDPYEPFAAGSGLIPYMERSWRPTILLVEADRLEEARGFAEAYGVSEQAPPLPAHGTDEVREGDESWAIRSDEPLPAWKRVSPWSLIVILGIIGSLLILAADAIRELLR